MSTTNNIGLFFPNRAREVTPTGGSWLSSAPLANLIDGQPSKTARSTDALNASTKAIWDFSSAIAFRAFAVRGNFSRTARWRVSLGTSSGGTQVYTSGWVDCWNLSTQEAAFTAIGVQDRSGDRPDEEIIMVLAQFYSARYLMIEFDDTTNTDGYVDWELAFAGGGLIPGENASYGLKKLRPSMSTVSRSESGSQWVYRRRQGTGVSLVLEWLTPAEKKIVDEMQRQLDITNELLYVPDIGDSEATQRDGFIGLLRVLNEIDYPRVRTRALPFAIDRRM